MSQPTDIENMESRRWRPLRTLAVALALLTALAVWLWPLGFGGAMPVGGDVTRFQIGLMAYYQDALKEGRLPLWNELWGFGFPGLAESQMGVFYPPHLLLYGSMPLESAYALSLILHTILAGWGAMRLASRLGISAIGSGIAGWSYAASGFFLIHMSHQWGYSVAAWTPWALALAWDIGDRQRRSDPIKLAMVLALQMLPGHFQLAFYTQCAVLFVVVWRMIERRREPGAMVGGLARLGAIALAMMMAAAQLIPTYELAKLAESTRDADYLSQFGASPPHLINFVAPELFHRMPLWRPIAWDPFHTSPEEHLTTIGLVPLFLALGAIRGGWRSDRDSRLLTALALFALLMSLGPYLPGFSWYCRLPGFSFFRAPARWSVILLLALAILAGKGWDRLPSWERVGRGLRRFVAISAAAIALTIGLFETALFATEGTGAPGIATAFDRALAALPWPDDPKVRDLAKIARSPQTDFRAELALAREGFFDRSPQALTWEDQRFVGYRLELTKTAGWLTVLVVASLLTRWPKAFAVVLLAATVGEGWSIRDLRGVREAPIAELTAASSLLKEWKEGGPGRKVIASDLKNLPMSGGAAALASYRTLDLPAQEGWFGVVQGFLSPNASDRDLAWKVVDLLGWVSLVIEPPSTGAGAAFGPDRVAAQDDRELATWLYGREWVESPRGRSEFRTRSYFDAQDSIAGRALVFEDANGDWAEDSPSSFAERIRRLPERRLSIYDLTEFNPELMNFNIQEKEISAQGMALKPVRILIPQLHYPRWRATWTPFSAPGRPAPVPQPIEVRKTAGGWMSVEIQELRPGSLILRYDDGDVRLGLAISAVAWLAGSGAWFILQTRSIRIWRQKRNRRLRSGDGASDAD